MTPDDAKIIFINIVELAVFSDSFCTLLEVALGSTLDGGSEDDDAVGTLFLEILPEMEKPYNTYITRQRAADEHLQNLPKTPALEAYFARTRAVSTSISHAWDLHSLLIKPVQRFLKYPLLLNAIIAETSDLHPDKENLKSARAKIEEMARNVNEDSRRVEVVKGVLSSKKTKTSAPTTALVKMKSIRSPSRGAGGENEEALLVSRLSTELHRIELFAQQFARNILDWAKAMSVLILSLRTWSSSFSKVIGLSEENSSEAFEAFQEVIEKALMPLCVDLENAINERLLKDLAHLLTTMGKPMKLIASMEEQEAMHFQLLNMNVSKNRPPPALLEASSNYLALRGQLAKELPRYVALMDRGLSCFVRKLAEIQKAFYGDVRDRWAELWEMLRVDGEINAGAEETISVWWSRWGDVDHLVSGLSITNPRKVYQDPGEQILRPNLAPLKLGSSTHVAQVMASLDSGQNQQKKKEQNKSQVVSGVVGMLMSLEPTPPPNVSHPYPLSPPSSIKTRGRGSSTSTASGEASRRSPSRRSPAPTRRPSVDSIKSGRSRRRQTPPRRPGYLDLQDEQDFADYINAMSISSPSPPPAGALTRMKSMPLPQSLGPIPPEDPPRKPSFTRKLSDQLRPGSSSNRQQHRPKTPSFDGFDHPPSSFMQTHTHRLASSVSSPSPTSSTFPRMQGKYACCVIHPFHPPYPVSYTCPFLLYPGPYPFLDLLENQIVEILEETGHPRAHPGLPLVVDENPDEEDCLLLCRRMDGGEIGWALASFLQPIQ